MKFTHLHVHSEYSLLMSSARIKDMAKKAAAEGMPALALTDNGNMFGAVQHYFTCLDMGVKPILGLEVYIAPESRLDKNQDRDQRRPNRKLVLLAKNWKGYQNLCKISTIGYHEGFYYVPRIDYEVLEQTSEGLVALSGDVMGEVAWNFLNLGEQEATDAAQKLKNIYGDDFYLELNRTGIPQWRTLEPFLIRLGKELDIPLVATNNVHYFHRDDQIAQEVLVCIGSNKTLQDENRFRLGSDKFYFRSAEEMIHLFSDLPEAIENTQVITAKCNITFKLKDDQGKQIYHLPIFPTRENLTLKEEIARIAFEGLEQRFAELKRIGKIISEEMVPIYKERLQFELDVIDGMGFNGYFLIVQDFIGWSKSHGIPVGPGRGSGAGSLVAYCLFITDLDPIPYNLIFERFLNPERVSMPDFDIDFCQEGRQRVIEYVTEKYTPQAVSQIITYGKLQARAAIRDVGRVMGMTYGEVDVVSKLMPDVLGITIDEAIEMEPRIKEMMEVDPKIQTLMDLARKVEGLVRHAGIHAAGVVIGDTDLVNLSPLYRGAQGENVVQYDMKHAEKIGLIKFDFLGLKTLTHINDALRLIKENRGKEITTKDISIDDPGIYALMQKGDTNGIFQFEGDGITGMIQKAKPDQFEDIVAATALYRPGPMAMIPDYLERKHGTKKVEYLFEELVPILKETFGIVVYQEHVQLIAAKIANYSLGEADMLRRAMGKKIPEEMAKQKKRFLEGAAENKYDSKKAEELFEMMAEFAKYGFNKSHAAAYCVVTAQTAWLKHYYPVEFFAALLGTEMSDTDKIVKYVKDAQRHNIDVRSPHINFSDYKFGVNGDTIFFSLGAIKGVGRAAVEAILEARKECENGKFESLEQFFTSVDLRRVNKKTVECLIKAGAFDSFGFNRAELMAGYGKFIDRADQVRKDRELGQGSLFALDEEIQEQEKVRIEPVEPWSRTERLANEKEVLGFYLSEHPLEGMLEITRKWTTGDILSLKEAKAKSTVRVLGLVSGLREIITKKGTRMAFAALDDMAGSIELIVFPDVFQEVEMDLKGDGAVIVGGVLEKDEEQLKILVDQIRPLKDLFTNSKAVTFSVSENLKEEALPRLKSLFEKYPGEAPVKIEVSLGSLKKVVQLTVIEPKGIQPSQEFYEEAQGLLGDQGSLQFQD
ncbi:MAG: DNA polymerase III subunit alpha [Bdellovibrionales bacterium]|nr:DNA polymerase III subunit alpha [Bdellovibrionales bacterium]